MSEQGPSTVEPTAELTQQEDILKTPEAGRQVVRGSVLRVGAYAAGALLTAIASVLLLRHLGVVQFGRYVTVMAIIAIISGVTDAGLTIVGSRELARAEPGRARADLMGNLVGLRLVLTPVGVVLGIGFAAIAGYGSTIVTGTALAGLGLVLVNTQATLMGMLTVEMRNGRLAAADILRQFATVCTIAALVAGGSALSAFFSVQIAVGLVMIVATPVLLGRAWRVRPRLDRGVSRRLFAESVPIAISYALSLVYFRLLLILLSLNSTEYQTGIFGTSLRIFELLLGIPTVVLGVALPVVSASVSERERLRYQVQRLTEAAVLVSSLIAVAVILSARPIVLILGGHEFAPAADVLRLHVIALIPVFVGNVANITLVALGRQRALVAVNAIALVFLLVLGTIATHHHGARAAAGCAIAAETVLAVMTLWVLARQPERPAPSLVFVWRIVVAVAAGLAIGLVPGVPGIVAGVVGAAVFTGVAFLMRAVPAELLQAIPGRGAPEVVR